MERMPKSIVTAGALALLIAWSWPAFGHGTRGANYVGFSGSTIVSQGRNQSDDSSTSAFATLVSRLDLGPLADNGVIWVLTPKTGKPGHVLPAEIAEAAPTAGLMPTSSVNLGDWSASQLVQPKSRTGKR